MTKVQFIHDNGEPVFAVVPIGLYNSLFDVAEDERTSEEIMEDIEAGREETFPDDFVARLIDTDCPLLEWRKYRGLTQKELAEAAGTSQAAIALIEKGKRNPGMETARRIADALNCDLDDLF